MVVRLLRVYAESQHHHIKKSRLGQLYPAGAVIIPRVEVQLINTRLISLALQKWRIAATVDIG